MAMAEKGDRTRAVAMAEKGDRTSLDHDDIGLGELFDEEFGEGRFFSFDDISWQHQDANKTLVTFSFSSNDRKEITSSMIIGDHISQQHFEALFAIGMCVLPWYWMKFGCERIIIRSHLCLSEEMLEFWQTLYSNVLLEFLFLNKMSECPKLFLSGDKRDNILQSAEPTFQCRGPILVPIGGKDNSSEFDSIVLVRRKR